ncbi:hypothetical protein [Bacillus safensis]|uniref:hypothetical protein n=1 Tax=Bacillus safensis TaxID=561879 RepID=UPI0009BF2D7E|nr:hypothetical protein [Bacillus safensis]ARD57386.1 hypothetical protein BRL64_14905 [Bacillus safensis]
MEDLRIDIPTVEKHMKKPLLPYGLKRFILYPVGMIMTAVGIALSLTLFLAIIGIPLFISGMTLLVIGGVAKTVQCPYCDKSNMVRERSEDFKCKRCEKPVKISWIYEKPRP